MNKTFRAILLIAVGIGSIAAAAEPRQPTARWVVNYDDAQCVASRNYGSEDKPLFLALKPSPTASVMRIMLIRNGSLSDAEQRQAWVWFGDGAPIAAKALAFGDPKTKRVVASINLPSRNFASNRGVASIGIKAGSLNERLAVPGLGGVMAAFDDCLANLRKVWNVATPVGSRNRRAQLSRSAICSGQSTYPAQAVREGDTGRVGLALLVDEAGKVRDCMVEETSGFATLDTMSCYAITSKARFEPATGAAASPSKARASTGSSGGSAPELDPWQVTRDRSPVRTGPEHD